MAYCATADVQALVSQVTFSGATKPTTTQITTWIDQISQELDGVMASADYAVPITATQSLKILNVLCAHAVASMAIQTAEFGIEPAASEQAARYRIIYEQGLENIKKLTNYLHDAVAEGVGGGARIRSYQVDNTDVPDPIFTIDMDW